MAPSTRVVSHETMESWVTQLTARLAGTAVTAAVRARMETIAEYILKMGVWRDFEVGYFERVDCGEWTENPGGYIKSEESVLRNDCLVKTGCTCG